MVMLVSLDYASAHVRRDTTDDDADLTAKIEWSSDCVINYLGPQATFLETSGDVATDSAGNPLYVPNAVKGAVCLLAAEYYKNREAMQDGRIGEQWGYGYLPYDVVNMLYPLRDPVIG